MQNQLWLLSVFMCICTVPVFRTATSTLLAMMQTANQASLTTFLHARGWLAEHVSFVTPSSLGGTICCALQRGIFDPANAALVAAGSSLGGTLGGEVVRESCPRYELRCVTQSGDGAWTVISGSGGGDGGDGDSWTLALGITDAGRQASALGDTHGFGPYTVGVLG